MRADSKGLLVKAFADLPIGARAIRGLSMARLLQCFSFRHLLEARGDMWADSDSWLTMPADLPCQAYLDLVSLHLTCSLGDLGSFAGFGGTHESV